MFDSIMRYKKPIINIFFDSCLTFAGVITFVLLAYVGDKWYYDVRLSATEDAFISFKRYILTMGVMNPLFNLGLAFLVHMFAMFTKHTRSITADTSVFLIRQIRENDNKNN
jgi:hypothetical protein